jgi:hypothetical protein
MLSSAAGKATTHTEARRARRNKSSLVSRKIWLPKLLYDSLPYFYLASGMVAFLATLYISEWFWILPHYVLFSAVCLHLGIIVYRRRHEKATGPTDNTE